MADAVTNGPDDKVGSVDTARGSMRPLIIVFTFMMFFGLAMMVAGATGLGFIDRAASPADRARMMDTIRVPVMGGGALLMALGGLVRWGFSSVVKGIHASEPQGDARHDPFAWMMHISRLGRGKWRGPYQGRTVSLQRYATRTGGCTTLFTFDVRAHTRLAWMRRPAIGEQIDRLAAMKSEAGGPYGFAQLDLSMAEAPWARDLFEAPGVREAIATLTNEEPFVLVIVRPGKLSAHYPGGPKEPLDEATLGAKLTALSSIAKAIESSPDPAQRLEPNAIERFGDKYS